MDSAKPRNGVARIERQSVVSFGQLVAAGFTRSDVTTMFSNLKIFPTPFKGIYYVPLEEERKGTFIERPLIALYQAVELFLGGGDFYFSGEIWETVPGLAGGAADLSIHVVNKKVSRRISLRNRAERNGGKGNWRSRKMAKLLALYGNEIVFHRSSGINAATSNNAPFEKAANLQDAYGRSRRFQLWK